MQIISDIDKNRKIILESINKYGFTFEHNYHCYYYDLGKDESNKFVLFDDCAGILCKHNEKKKEWRIFSEVLAPRENRNKLLVNFCKNILENTDTKKVIVELSDNSRIEVLQLIKNDNIKANKINYSLEWPVFDLKSWVGDKMEGKNWKNLRYYWNKFQRDHDVKFTDVKTIKKKELLLILDEWKKKRNCNDYVKIRPYQLMIENKFLGFDHTRVLIVNGEVCGVTAGFKLKNNNYYSCVGLLNYKYDRMGEVMNIDDLLFLKKQGYNLVDWGGSLGDMITFKKKFFPTYWYSTHIFSIVKKNQKNSN